jgi:hypothetical protein
MTLELYLGNPVVRPIVTNFVRAAVTGAVIAATSPATSSLLLVGGAYLAVGAAYYLWTEQQKQAIQNKAKEKYIAANPDSDVAGQAPFQGGQINGAMYYCGFNITLSDGLVVYFGKNDLGAQHLYGPVRSLRVARHPWANEVECFVTCRGTSATGLTELGEYKVHGIGGEWKHETFKITDLILASGGTDTGGNVASTSKPWEQWTDAQRTDAVNQLSDSDWLDTILNMPQSGTLERGQVLPNSIILTGNPTSDYEIDREPRAIPANTQIPTIFKDQPITETPAFQDVVTRLGGLETIALGLPIATAARVPNLAQIQSATETATCSAIKGDTCSGSPIPRMNNNIDSINQKLDALTQAGQGALLTAMNNTLNGISTVLGTKVIPGGLSSAFSRFTSWAGVDRAINLVTMVGVIHNCFMLSSSITETFFSALDNILNAGALIKNSEADDIDTKEIFTETIDKYMASLFGQQEWTLVKSQLKSYNSIYSSVSQAFGNVRDIIEETNNINQTATRYTAQLGNALQDEGLISEDNWDYKDPSHKAKTKFGRWAERVRDGLEIVENGFEELESVTGSVRSSVDSANETIENISEIDKAIDKANEDAKKDRETKEEGLEIPNFALGDLF